MRNATLILVLTTFMVVSAHAQFHGRCGDYRYTIDGKLISSVETNVAGANNNSHINTYYHVDSKNGYLWFWVEETEDGNNRISKFISYWARLSDLDTNSFDYSKNSSSEMLVHLKSSQNYFFSTVYTTQKKGPQYEVRNKLLIRFKNDQEASAFAKELKQYIPIHN